MVHRSAAHFDASPCRLEKELRWIANYRRVWDARFQALDGVIDELNRQEKARGRTNEG